jgi:hypothetical protein
MQRERKSSHMASEKEARRLGRSTPARTWLVLVATTLAPWVATACSTRKPPMPKPVETVLYWEAPVVTVVAKRPRPPAEDSLAQSPRHTPGEAQVTLYYEAPPIEVVARGVHTGAGKTCEGATAGTGCAAPAADGTPALLW